MKHSLDAISRSTLKIYDIGLGRHLIYTIIHHVFLVTFKPIDQLEKEIIGNCARN